MGQYKVPQDVEAEDKILGPLSLRQFIYVVIGVAWAGLMWLLLSKFVIVMVVAILPVTGFFILMGFGRRQEQSFENYFVALIKFLVEPRFRMWQKDLSQDQLVRKEQKPVEIIPTKNVTRGSLNQLALIMDTHGAQKDPSLQLQDESNQAIGYGQRVLDPSQVAAQQPIAVGGSTVRTDDDVLDSASPRVEQVNHLLENVETNIHAQALKNVQQAISAPAAIAQSAQAMQSPPQNTNAIIKKAVSQGNNLTVEQLSRETNAKILAPGQSVQLNTPNN